MGRKRKQNPELRLAMTSRIAGGMNRSEAAKDVARVFNVSVSTAYKSYLFNDEGNRRVPVKKTNLKVEYNKSLQDGSLALVYKILTMSTLRVDSVAARVGTSVEMVQYARKWGTRFREYELNLPGLIVYGEEPVPDLAYVPVIPVKRLPIPSEPALSDSAVERK